MSTNIRLAAGLSLSLLLTLAACGTQGGGTSAAKAPAGPVKGGTLTFAVNTEPSTCLDPHQSPADVAGLFTRPALDSLVSLDTEGRIHPWLATKWTVSPDQKTYTFTLREGVKFSDGTPFDAEAVKANLDHIVNPATKSQLAAGYIEPYKGTEVVDAHTVKVSFSRPYSPFLSALSTAYFGIESPQSLKQPQDALCKKVVGSGPFVIDEYVVQKGITYHRNPGYNWAPEGAAHTGAAYLDKLEFKVVTEDSVRLGALTSGQVDGIASVPPVNVKQVKADPRLTILTRQAPGGNYSYYPNTASGPFADKRVRQAFRDGIDFATIVNNLYFGAFQPAAGPISPSTDGYDKTLEGKAKYDPATANRLLDEAGWSAKDAQGYRTKDGKRLTIRWGLIKAAIREQRDTLAEQIQAEAKKIGFDVEFVAATVNDWIARYIKGDYDLMDFSWQRADGDALRNLFDSANIPSPAKFGQNAARLSDKEIDGWLSDALDTTDQAERAELYAKVQQRVTGEAAVFPVYVFNYLLGASKKTHGIGWEPQAYPTFYDAWVEQA
ncbi:ABC transporter substrate-binding protein [Microbispora sp. NBRC 16548]|uniref:ABC transporter substrate-binding protein n=1 Tax=Microbispora sp. NBRC 16548 TaxID=3030994 RepID=UPI0024A5281E|nr:ABC transporter substrate-binding protein [Microbispora sp. NBRC 16548]GLX10976.1 peptide ABC transporter [Microbispora sp. NBRC 16548]